MKNNRSLLKYLIIFSVIMNSSCVTNNNSEIKSPCVSSSEGPCDRIPINSLSLNIENIVI